MNCLRSSFALALMCLAGVSGAAAGERADAQPERKSITIVSDGVRLAGDLWTPPGFAPADKRPALLLVHGWGGTKAHLNQAYAPVFAAMGYVVLTFDYRGWGESDGKLLRTGDKPVDNSDTEADTVGPDSLTYTTEVREVRLIVDPIDQLEDIENAYHYLIAEPGVDASRLGVWGSSLGGGLALQTAATMPGFRVLMIQVGSVNPRAGSDTAFDPLAVRRTASARARGERPPFPGPESAVEGLRGYPDWLAFARYDPFSTHTGLQAATLIIDAADEELFDIRTNGAALFSAIRERVPARYEVLPGQHYDIYRGEGYATAVSLQKDWLDEHLPLAP